ncbi:hypothetical protein lerEdw1_008218 [Lerista edwardsae]|nr:hypothetical protein lerEdw1_008218 [Lerista edwardsae]
MMFTSIIFAAVGVVGAGYSFIVSAIALNKGPKCERYGNGTWVYPFENGEMDLFNAYGEDRNGLYQGRDYPSRHSF